MRSAKCARDCSEVSISEKHRKKPGMLGVASDLCSRVRTVDAARMLVDLVRRPCYSGLQPAVTKRIGKAARRKALVSDVATLVLCEIAAAGC